MTEQINPLTPAACDLQDFQFMPLMVARLRKSKAWVKAKRNPALGFYMVNLWAAAWHEVPAASLEDDEDVLADAAMCEPAKWAEVREEALRGWVKCSDGRLYHPVVAEKAVEAWNAKLAQRERTSAATAARAAKRLVEGHDAMKSVNARTDGQRDVGRVVHRANERDDQRHVVRNEDAAFTKGQGQGQGQEKGQEQGEKNPPSPPRKRRGAAAQDEFVTAEQIVADGVNEKHARDWLAIRKEKNLPLTPTAWDDTKAEAVKAGMTTDEAIRYSVVRSRGGFRASWIASDEPTAGVAGKAPQGDAARQAANDETDAEALRILRGRATGASGEIGHG